MAIDIKAAWDKITLNSLNKVWKRLWPEARNDLLESDEEPPAVINNIVELANEGGVEMSVLKTWSLMVKV